MALNPGMATGLLARFVRSFVAVKIDLPTGTIRLLDASGVVTFSAGTFTGSDPIGGTLKSISVLSESMATEAPRFQIGLFPDSPGAIADLCAVNAQGSEVTVYAGIVDDATGAVLGVPEVIMHGMTDVPRLLVSPLQRYVEIDCGTVFDRMFSKSEGGRWIDGEHQSIWPGEDGLAHVAKAGDYPLWGTEPQNKK